MDQIIIKRAEKARKPKRTAVVVSPETYIRVYAIAHEAGITVESLVDTMLTEALKHVKVED